MIPQKLATNNSPGDAVTPEPRFETSELATLSRGSWETVGRANRSQACPSTRRSVSDFLHAMLMFDHECCGLFYFLDLELYSVCLVLRLSITVSKEKQPALPIARPAQYVVTTIQPTRMDQQRPKDESVGQSKSSIY